MLCSFVRRRFWPEKRAQRLSFWVRRPPGGVGVFHAKGWWPKSSCPPSKLCLPWVSKRGIRDVPGIWPGCPGPLRVFKKFVQKKFVCIFRSLDDSGQFPQNPREVTEIVRGQNEHASKKIRSSKISEPYIFQIDGRKRALKVRHEGVEIRV